MASPPTTACRVLYLRGYGGYEKMEIDEMEIPSPKPGEVLVNIKFSGINFAELMCRMGLYANIPALPAVLGLEGSGDVITIGEGVQKIKVGDRVMCMTNAFGLWCEYAVIPEQRCFRIPDSMSYEQAAAIPVNYVTAHNMLFDMGNLRRGRSVLVHMVAGGVGTAAVQLIRTVPDTVIFGTCSAAKCGHMEKMGVDHVIDYTTQDYAEEVRKVSPQGVDIVLDSLNGPDASKGYNLLKPMGRIIHFGAANVVTSPILSYWQMAKLYLRTYSVNSLFSISTNKGVFGYHMGHLDKRPEIIVEAVEDIFEKFEKGQINPTIDSVWALEDVGLAMARMHERKNIGKVLLSAQVKPGQTDIRNSIS